MMNKKEKAKQIVNLIDTWPRTPEETQELYAKQEELALAWAKEYGLVEDWSGDFSAFGFYKSGRPLWGDHSTGWQYKGQPAVVVSQPYHLSKEDLLALMKTCEKSGLDVKITASNSWYYPGQAMMIELWDPRVRDQIDRDKTVVRSYAQGGDKKLPPLLVVGERATGKTVFIEHLQRSNPSLRRVDIRDSGNKLTVWNHKNEPEGLIGRGEWESNFIYEAELAPADFPGKVFVFEVKDRDPRFETQK